MDIYLKNKQTLQIDDYYFKCSIGKMGLTLKKKEGDIKTPKGIFGIENLYFRKDRLKKPQTNLKQGCNIGPAAKISCMPKTN